MDKQREKFEKWWDQQPAAWRDGVRPVDARRVWQAALVSRDAEPVAWVQKDMLYDDGFTHAFNVQPYAAENYVPLYTAPPNLSAAVAAAREQAAQVVMESVDGPYPYKMRKPEHQCVEEIRALQTEDGLAALREFGMKVAREASESVDVDEKTRLTGKGLEAVVDRVMKGE